MKKLRDLWLNPYSKFTLISSLLLIVAAISSVYSIILQQNYHILWWVFFVTHFLGGIESVYYHRYLSHRSWQPPKWLEYIFLTIGAGFHNLPAMFYAGGHRIHHKYSDVDGDIAGPTLSFKENLHVAVGGSPEVPFQYLKDMVEDKHLIFQTVHYWSILAAVGFIWSLLFGLDVFLFIVLVSRLYMLLINYTFHYFKSPWGGRDNNIMYVLGLTGEWLHEKHHIKPGDPKLGGMFDIYYWLFVKHFPKN